MKIKTLFLTGIIAFLFGCNKDTIVPIPSPGSAFINETYPLHPDSKLLMEGVYSVTSGSEKFGQYIVLK